MLAYTTSYFLPTSIIYVAKIVESKIQLAIFRLFAYALPSLLNLLGGLLYDKLGPRIMLLSILQLIPIVTLTRNTLLLVYPLLTAVSSLIQPMITAHIGKLFTREILPLALALYGLTGTLAVGLNMYILAQLQETLTKLYLAMLIILQTVILIKLGQLLER